MTWLSGSSIGGGAEEMMMAQLQAMEEELRKANQHIDENFKQLEKRGLLGCSLADELADAHSQIANLKERLQKFRQQHNRAIDQLVATECPGCDLLFDAAEPLRKVAVDNGLDSRCVMP
jgi:chromosome segregation ATPase